MLSQHFRFQFKVDENFRNFLQNNISLDIFIYEDNLPIISQLTSLAYNLMDFLQHSVGEQIKKH